MERFIDNKVRALRRAYDYLGENFTERYVQQFVSEVSRIDAHQAQGILRDAIDKTEVRAPADVQARLLEILCSGLNPQYPETRKWAKRVISNLSPSWPFVGRRLWQMQYGIGVVQNIAMSHEDPLPAAAALIACDDLEPVGMKLRSFAVQAWIHLLLNGKFDHRVPGTDLTIFEALTRLIVQRFPTDGPASMLSLALSRKLPASESGTRRTVAAITLGLALDRAASGVFANRETQLILPEVAALLLQYNRGDLLLKEHGGTANR